MNRMVEMPRLMKVQEVAEYLRCHKSMVYDLLRSGRIPAKGGGRHPYIIKAADVEAYYESLPDAVDKLVHVAA